MNLSPSYSITVADIGLAMKPQLASLLLLLVFLAAIDTASRPHEEKERVAPALVLIPIVFK